MGLRVSGGSLRGRPLSVPRGQAVRPTASRVREALFSMLGQDFDGLAVLDLFAGAGTLGVEAASRGAARVVFVERDRAHAAVLQANVEALLEGRGELLRLDVLRALDLLAGRAEPFDLVFMDPPYRQDLESPTLERLSNHAQALLAPNATVVVEAAREPEPPARVGVLARTSLRRYGDTVLAFYSQQRDS